MNEKPVVIITGAAGGIGKATALAFAARGYRLSLVDKDEQGLDTLKRLPAIENTSLFLAGDLESHAFLESIVRNTVDAFGRIDVLVNNAAWRTIETMRTITPEAWDKTLRVNLTAPAFLARDCAEIMQQKQIGGVILNVSSIMSERTGGYGPAYVVCKAALESLTYELATLYGPHGIRVVAVKPGNIETNLSTDYVDEQGNNVSSLIGDDMKDHTPLKRAGRPEEVATLLAWLASGEASFITGTAIVADGGFSHNFNSYQIKHLQFPKQF